MTHYDRHNEEMIIITINIPRSLDAIIMKLKKWGLIPSRSEVLRHAAIKYCQELYKLAIDVRKDLENFDHEKFVRVPGYNGNKPVRIIRRLE